MTHSGVPEHTRAYSTVPGRTRAYLVVPRRTQAYWGVLGCTRAYLGVLGRTRASSGLLGHTRAYLGVPAPTWAYSGVIRPTRAYSLLGCNLLQSPHAAAMILWLRQACGATRPVLLSCSGGQLCCNLNPTKHTTLKATKFRSEAPYHCSC